MFANGDVLIQKFGGSSMGSVERIKRVAERIAEKARRGLRLVVVVSAMGDTTDDLISLMNKMTPLPERRELDHIMATGEMVSASLAAAALTDLGIRARSFNAYNLQLLSELQGDDYNIVKIGRAAQLAGFLEPGSVAVVAGFQGITQDGDLTTLGRGGSDLTAVVLARELGQKVCEKYTDEDGIYTADPRVIPDARKVWHLSYDEMLTLAGFGNGILHPRAISSARDCQIRIHVRSSFSTAEGSVVGPDGDDQIAVKSITCDQKFVYVRIHGVDRPDDQFFSELAGLPFKPAVQQFKSFNNMKGSLRIGFRRSDAFVAIPFCWEQAARMNAEEVDCFANLTTLSLIGCGLINNSGLAATFSRTLGDLIPVVEQHESIRLSYAFEKNDVKTAMEALHRAITTQHGSAA
ncbi:MAG: aspartate kinase [Candidatus Riflebacteria bacterium]|jgi:aspartate kinase|nr:aspartate kinase [Candidatus Riflebacteria bacterium]